MSKQINLQVKFAAFAEFSVNEVDLKKFAKEEGYDWKEKDEREEAIAAWVNDHAYPDSFLSLGGFVALSSDLNSVRYEVCDGAILDIQEI